MAERTLQQIGEWKLLDEITVCCAVFSAVNVRTGVQAAVKAVNGAKLTQKKLVDSLKTEVHIQQGINHPNIVKLLDYISSEFGPRGERQDTYYLVLEYCDGGDLASFLESRKRSGRRGIDEATARKLLRQLAMGLQEMHELRIVHRDLKPGNILLASTAADTCLKIADFGFARALAPALLAETLCGSPLYMAPEVLSEAPYDGRADLWSVGVIMFEMLVGSVPFTGNNIVHLKRVIDTTEAKLNRDMCEQLSPACQDLLRGLLQKTPSRRLSFDVFFKHPFLSGHPLLTHKPVHAGPFSTLESRGEPESTESDIEQDWLILDAPTDESAPAFMEESALRGVNRAKVSASRSGHGEDLFPQLSDQLPSCLTEEQLLYGAALRVADISGWKTEAGDFLAALSLQLLAVRLLDHLLNKLTSRPPAADPNSDAVTASAPSPAHTRFPAPHDSSPKGSADGSAASLHDVALSSVHRPSSGGHEQPVASPSHVQDAVPHVPDPHARQASQPFAQAMPSSTAASSAMPIQLRISAHALFHRLLRSSVTLSNDLMRRDRSYTIPCSLGLVWQGMLSIARSAGMDEMFCSYNKAVQGYAQAANLVWLLSWHATMTSSQPSQEILHDLGSSSLSNATRSPLPAVPEHPTSAAAHDADNDSQSGSSSASAHFCMREDESGARATCHHGGDDDDARCHAADSEHGRALVDALQDTQKVTADLPHFLDWHLSEEQVDLLRSYSGLLFQRHACCLRPPALLR